MVTDLEIFTLKEVVELAFNEVELKERILEGISLINE